MPASYQKSCKDSYQNSTRVSWPIMLMIQIEQCSALPNNGHREIRLCMHPVNSTKENLDIFDQIKGCAKKHGFEFLVCSYVSFCTLDH